ncbi:MAG: hypothetical protein MMC33_009015 [Icmadophila ericetorum]|nr:hypothetical protein [Icmadophila ericetorum]
MAPKRPKKTAAVDTSETSVLDAKKPATRTSLPGSSSKRHIVYSSSEPRSSSEDDRAPARPTKIRRTGPKEPTKENQDNPQTTNSEQTEKGTLEHQPPQLKNKTVYKSHKPEAKEPEASSSEAEGPVVSKNSNPRAKKSEEPQPEDPKPAAKEHKLPKAKTAKLQESTTSAKKLPEPKAHKVTKSTVSESSKPKPERRLMNVPSSAFQEALASIHSPIRAPISPIPDSGLASQNTGLSPSNPSTTTQCKDLALPTPQPTLVDTESILPNPSSLWENQKDTLPGASDAVQSATTSRPSPDSLHKSSNLPLQNTIRRRSPRFSTLENATSPAVALQGKTSQADPTETVPPLETWKEVRLELDESHSPSSAVAPVVLPLSPEVSKQTALKPGASAVIEPKAPALPEQSLPALQDVYFPVEDGILQPVSKISVSYSIHNVLPATQQITFLTELETKLTLPNVPEPTHQPKIYDGEAAVNNAIDALETARLKSRLADTALETALIYKLKASQEVQRLEVDLDERMLAREAADPSGSINIAGGEDQNFIAAENEHPLEYDGKRKTRAKDYSEQYGSYTADTSRKEERPDNTGKRDGEDAGGYVKTGAEYVHIRADHPRNSIEQGQECHGRIIETVTESDHKHVDIPEEDSRFFGPTGKYPNHQAGKPNTPSVGLFHSVKESGFGTFRPYYSGNENSDQHSQQQSYQPRPLIGVAHANTGTSLKNNEDQASGQLGKQERQTSYYAEKPNADSFHGNKEGHSVRSLWDGNKTVDNGSRSGSGYKMQEREGFQGYDAYEDSIPRQVQRRASRQGKNRQKLPESYVNDSKASPSVPHLRDTVQVKEQYPLTAPVGKDMDHDANEVDARAKHAGGYSEHTKEPASSSAEHRDQDQSSSQYIGNRQESLRGHRQAEGLQPDHVAANAKTLVGSYPVNEAMRPHHYAHHHYPSPGSGYPDSRAHSLSQKTKPYDQSFGGPPRGEDRNHLGYGTQPENYVANSKSRTDIHTVKGVMQPNCSATENRAPQGENYPANREYSLGDPSEIPSRYDNTSRANPRGDPGRSPGHGMHPEGKFTSAKASTDAVAGHLTRGRPHPDRPVTENRVSQTNKYPNVQEKPLRVYGRKPKRYESSQQVTSGGYTTGCAGNGGMVVQPNRFAAEQRAARTGDYIPTTAEAEFLSRSPKDSKFNDKPYQGSLRGVGSGPENRGRQLNRFPASQSGVYPDNREISTGASDKTHDRFYRSQLGTPGTDFSSHPGYRMRLECYAEQHTPQASRSSRNPRESPRLRGVSSHRYSFSHHETPRIDFTMDRAYESISGGVEAVALIIKEEHDPRPYPQPTKEQTTRSIDNSGESTKRIHEEMIAQAESTTMPIEKPEEEILAMTEPMMPPIAKLQAQVLVFSSKRNTILTVTLRLLKNKPAATNLPLAPVTKPTTATILLATRQPLKKTLASPLVEPTRTSINQDSPGANTGPRIGVRREHNNPYLAKSFQAYKTSQADEIHEGNSYHALERVATSSNAISVAPKTVFVTDVPMAEQEVTPAAEPQPTPMDLDEDQMSKGNQMWYGDRPVKTGRGARKVNYMERW